MQGDEERARLGYSGGVTSRAKSFMAKTAAVVVGGVMLASAFVVSLAFFAFALAVALVLGGYLWWKTRDLRKQMREQFRGQTHVHDSQRAGSSGEVIEGVVISRGQTRDDSDHMRRP
jgi:membrane protein implicated in regulation of membrane protease activity